MYCLCFNMVSLILGVKRSSGYAQIGLFQGFNSKFPTSIPNPFISVRSSGPGRFYSGMGSPSFLVGSTFFLSCHYHYHYYCYHQYTYHIIPTASTKEQTILQNFKNRKNFKLTRMSSEKNRREEKTFFYTNAFQSTTEKTWEDFDQGNRKLTVQSPVRASKES